MHDCPRCGLSCCCSGDIDDTVAMSDEWVSEHCAHECEDDDLEYDEYDDWEYEDSADDWDGDD